MATTSDAATEAGSAPTETGTDTGDEAEAGPDGETHSRKWAVLAVLPFLAIGLADVILLLYWGIEPLWGFAILPPILFCTVLAWIVFSTDFLEGRT
jgi:hypothetical protein